MSASAERLCKSALAHGACRFKGERIEQPIAIGCKAPDHMYSACPYADQFGVQHQIWRGLPDQPTGGK